MINHFSRKLGDVFLWLFIFLQLFGPKLGFVDTSVLSSGIAAIVVASAATSKLRVNPHYVTFIFALAIFYVYTLFLAAINGGEDSYTLLRYFRFLASAILLPLVFCFLRNYSAETVIRMIGSCMIVHALFVIIQMLFPEFKEVMGPWVGYNNQMFLLRAFGLVGAYDAAAAYLCIGMLIYASLFYAGARGYRIGAAILFLWVAGLFTGRLFMVIGTIILGAIFFYYLFRGAMSAVKLVLLTIFMVGIVSVWMTFGEFIMASFTADSDVYLSNELFQREGGYSLSSMGYISDMMSQFYPEEPINLMFGGLSNPEWTDIGYSKLLYTHGLVGLVWMLCIYVILVVASVSRRRRLLELPSIVTMFTFFIILIFNYKMLVFGSRGYTELLLILVLSSGLANKKCEARNTVAKMDPSVLSSRCGAA